MRTLLFTFLSFLCISANAQTIIADSLRAPVGVGIDAQGRAWVVESGYGFNDGAVSLVQGNGDIWPVVVGLPSLFDTVNQEGVGPWHTLELPGNRLAITVGATGQVLIFDLTGFTPGISAPQTLAEAVATLNIAEFVLGQGIPESDPYSMALDEFSNLYVADAAANAIIKVTPAGQMSVFATFPATPNPLPFGPPMVDAVPTRIISKPGGGFYVCQLTGFPFLDGSAQIFLVDATGAVSTYAWGLTTLTDMALDAATGDLYVLQFGHFELDPNLPPGFAPGSARVTRIKPNGTQEVVLENFDLSAGLALDAQGNLYITQIATGELLKWDNITTASHELKAAVNDLSVAPNPVATQARISFSLPDVSDVQLRVLNAQGQLVYTQNLGRLPEGAHQTEWLPGACPSGAYQLEIITERGRAAHMLVRM